MRTLLIVTKQPSLASAIEAVLDLSKFQLITKESVLEAEYLLARGAIDATIVDLDLTDTRAVRMIEELKSHAPGCPVLVYTGARQWEWEEDAYLLGVEHVLTKPVRGRLLNNLLDRLFPEKHDRPAAAVAGYDAPAARGSHEPLRALEALRRFSGVLTHSLDAAALLKQFLLILREVIGVNRAIIFLRKPSGAMGDSAPGGEDRWLRSACAIGLDQAMFQHFALSLSAGIGGSLHRHGRILRASAPEAQASRDITKEFQLLGAQVAIPILDRQTLLGVAVLDERLTGEPYLTEELSMIFHMLEEVGLAVRNSWLHVQVQANHAMIADILGQLGSGCMVVSETLTMLHANPAANRLFALEGRSTGIEFADLPQQLGSMVFTVVKTGTPITASRQKFAQSGERSFTVAIHPFRTQGATSLNSALLIIDDMTEHERAQQLDIEASNLRLVKSMAEHLAHEIGNSLVPISTHQQLLKEQINDPEFQTSLSMALAIGVRRISRLSSQMMFLARDWSAEFEHEMPIADLIVEAFHEAHTYHPGKKVAQLSFNKNIAPWKVRGDHKALRHAFSEIMLNALQANPDEPTVAVKLEELKSGEGQLRVEVRDSGSGFSAETAKRAQEPFFSTRSVGLGIGLTVSRRIIESHNGLIEISDSKSDSGCVRISLPIAEKTPN